MESRIQGVVFKELVSHADPRGYFREIIRATDPFFNHPFGQWSHSLMFDGVIKAWHYHKIQTDYFYVVTGVARVGLCDLRKDSPSYQCTMDFLMGDFQSPQIVKVPPGIAHGVKTIQGPVNLMYMMSHTYDPSDEIRIPYNDPSIRFDWLSGPPIT
jgi:dTDP-4-dehydrorhamnose 3,5-epimerase